MSYLVGGRGTSALPLLSIGELTRRGLKLVAYRIEYSPDVKDHLHALTTRQQSMVIDGVDKQLRHRPTLETRNRKPMRPNLVAPWEMRLGNLRVYYEVEQEPEAVVRILAVGIKERNRVRIGKEVIDL
jgi:mRNA-degrading endonuclease RelE of RelBE toxin-antitoxin system